MCSQCLKHVLFAGAIEKFINICIQINRHRKQEQFFLKCLYRVRDVFLTKCEISAAFQFQFQDFANFFPLFFWFCFNYAIFSL